MKPQIRERRIYDSASIPILYPGEQAHAAAFDVVEHSQDITTLEVRAWMVEPAPGWKARWQRCRYRWLRWLPLFANAKPKLSVSLFGDDIEREVKR